MQCDIDTLEGHLEDLAFAHISEGDLAWLTESGFAQLFRVMQMLIEYLLYVQNALHNRNIELETQASHANSQVATMQAQLVEQALYSGVLESRISGKPVATGLEGSIRSPATMVPPVRGAHNGSIPHYGILPVPSAAIPSFRHDGPAPRDSPAQCALCFKLFESNAFLSAHMQRRHPRFAAHVPPEDATADFPAAPGTCTAPPGKGQMPADMPLPVVDVDVPDQSLVDSIAQELADAMAPLMPSGAPTDPYFLDGPMRVSESVAAGYFTGQQPSNEGWGMPPPMYGHDIACSDSVPSELYHYRDQVHMPDPHTMGGDEGYLAAGPEQYRGEEHANAEAQEGSAHDAAIRGAQVNSQLEKELRARAAAAEAAAAEAAAAVEAGAAVEAKISGLARDLEKRLEEQSASLRRAIEEATAARVAEASAAAAEVAAAERRALEEESRAARDETLRAHEAAAAAAREAQQAVAEMRAAVEETRRSALLTHAVGGDARSSHSRGLLGDMMLEDGDGRASREGATETPSNGDTAASGVSSQANANANDAISRAELIRREMAAAEREAERERLLAERDAVNQAAIEALRSEVQRLASRDAAAAGVCHIAAPPGEMPALRKQDRPEEPQEEGGVPVRMEPSSTAIESLRPHMQLPPARAESPTPPTSTAVRAISPVDSSDSEAEAAAIGQDGRMQTSDDPVNQAADQANQGPSPHASLDDARLRAGENETAAENDASSGVRGVPSSVDSAIAAAPAGQVGDTNSCAAPPTVATPVTPLVLNADAEAEPDRAAETATESQGASRVDWPRNVNHVEAARTADPPHGALEMRDQDAGGAADGAAQQASRVLARTGRYADDPRTHVPGELLPSNCGFVHSKQEWDDERAESEAQLQQELGEWDALAKCPLSDLELERLIEAKRKDSEEQAAFAKDACVRERALVEQRLEALVRANWKDGKPGSAGDPEMRTDSHPIAKEDASAISTGTRTASPTVAAAATLASLETVPYASSYPPTPPRVLPPPMPMSSTWTSQPSKLKPSGLGASEWKSSKRLSSSPFRALSEPSTSSPTTQTESSTMATTVQPLPQAVLAARSVGNDSDSSDDGPALSLLGSPYHSSAARANALAAFAQQGNAMSHRNSVNMGRLSAEEHVPLSPYSLGSSSKGDDQVRTFNADELSDD